LTATRCTFEDNEGFGMVVNGGPDTAAGRPLGLLELVDCATRKNGRSGLFVYLFVYAGKVTLRGGTISENKGPGVWISSGAKVTVTTAVEGKPQTVCKDNEVHDWSTDGRGEFIGIPQEKIIV